MNKRTKIISYALISLLSFNFASIMALAETPDLNSYELNEVNLPAEEIDGTERTPLAAAADQSAVLDMRLLTAGKIVAGQEIVVDLLVQPNGQAINLVNTTINFPTSTLILKKVDHLKSPFALYFIYPDKDGSVEVTAMQPFPGIAEEAVIATLTFETIVTAEANLTLADNSSVLANDGFGTEVLGTKYDLNFLVNR
jgi:hypothetical protein